MREGENSCLGFFSEKIDIRHLPDAAITCIKTKEKKGDVLQFESEEIFQEGQERKKTQKKVIYL